MFTGNEELHSWWKAIGGDSEILKKRSNTAICDSQILSWPKNPTFYSRCCFFENAFLKPKVFKQFTLHSAKKIIRNY